MSAQFEGKLSDQQAATMFCMPLSLARHYDEGMKKGLGIALAIAALCVSAGLIMVYRHGWPARFQGKTVEAWSLQALAGTPPERKEAEMALGELGQRAVPELQRMLQSTDLGARQQVYAWMPRLSLRLRQWLRSEVGPINQAEKSRQAAARALGMLGPQAKSAAPRLAQALEDPAPEVAWEAAQALSRIGVEGIPGLRGALSSESASVRQRAATALSLMGPAAEPAISALLERLDDKDAGVGDAAAYALSAINLPALAELLQVVDSGTGVARIRAAKALAWMPAPRRRTVPPLLKMLQDTDPSSRQQALKTLAAIYAVDEGAIKAMAQALRDPAVEVRLTAAQGLGTFGAKAAGAVPELVEALDAPSEAVRAMAARALGQIGAPAKPAVPKLSRLSQAGDSPLREAVRQALEEINIASPGP